MQCPKCDVELSEKRLHRGLKVDRCPQCKGMWLESHELDQLEDQAFDVDDLKGTLIRSSEATAHPCPQCGSKMSAFHYRLHDLELEYCENEHGFWLDHQEEKRVLALMHERAGKVVRKYEAEAEWEKTLSEAKAELEAAPSEAETDSLWEKTLSDLSSSSFLHRVRSLFK